MKIVRATNREAMMDKEAITTVAIIDTLFLDCLARVSESMVVVEDEFYP